MDTKARILAIGPDSDGHEAAIAAFSRLLMEEMAKQPEIEDAFYLENRNSEECGWELSKISHHGFACSFPVRDELYNESAYPAHTADILKRLFAITRPDVILIHSSPSDLPSIIRVIKPDTKIFMIAHEILPVYQSDRLARDGESLCHPIDFYKYAKSVTKRQQIDFWQVKFRLLRHLERIDGIITTSNFLQNYFLELGILPERLYTIETFVSPLRGKFGIETNARRFGFFGDSGPASGLEMLFMAMDMMDDNQVRNMALEFHTHSFAGQSDAYRKRIQAWLKKYGDIGVISWNDSYNPGTDWRLMTGVDWVIIPTIAPDSSTFGLHQAFMCGKPVLCATHSGLAEKTRDGADSLNVAVAAPFAWRDAILKACGNNALKHKLQNSITPLADPEATAGEYLAFMGIREDAWRL